MCVCLFFDDVRAGICVPVKNKQANRTNERMDERSFAFFAANQDFIAAQKHARKFATEEEAVLLMNDYMMLPFR